MLDAAKDPSPQTVASRHSWSAAYVIKGVVAAMMGAALPLLAWWSWWNLTEPRYWPAPWYSRYASICLSILALSYLVSLVIFWRFAITKILFFSSISACILMGGLAWILVEGH